MSITILIEDLYLDFTYSKEMNLQRRFFVKIELSEEDSRKETLSFMNEVNSAFLKYEKLLNIVVLETNNLIEYFSIEEENDKNRSIKELLILEKENVYLNLKKMIVSNLESLEESNWIDYCKQRYAAREVDFTEENKKLELEKFYKSNEKIKEIWSRFPTSMKDYSTGGDMKESQQIPDKFSNFWTEAHFFHLDKKLKKQNINEKKQKI